MGRFHGAIAVMGRGIALFFGGIVLIGSLAELRGMGAIGEAWLDLRRMPSLFHWVLPIAGVGLMTFGLGLDRVRSLRLWGTGSAAFLVFILIENALVVEGLRMRGVIVTSVFSASAIMAMAGSCCLVATMARRTLSPQRPYACVVVASFLVLAFPLLQIATLGQTDYRRQAEIIVVPGARAYADGRPSRALAERVTTACELFHEGHAACLVFSGGPGDGAIHETESARRMAVALGVPKRQIVIDENGWDTERTAEFVASMRAQGPVLFVSQDFHLARIRLAGHLVGQRFLTVPVGSDDPLPRRPKTLLRESLAYWYYLLRGLVSRAHSSS